MCLVAFTCMCISFVIAIPIAGLSLDWLTVETFEEQTNKPLRYVCLSISHCISHVILYESSIQFCIYFNTNVGSREIRDFSMCEEGMFVK